MVRTSTGLVGFLVFLAATFGGSLGYLQNCSKEFYRKNSFYKKIKHELIYSEDVWIPKYSLAKWELANQMIYIVEGTTNMILTDLVGEKTISSCSDNEKLEIIYLNGTNFFRENMIETTTALGRETQRVFSEGDAFYNHNRHKIRKVKKSKTNEAKIEKQASQQDSEACWLDMLREKPND